MIVMGLQLLVHTLNAVIYSFLSASSGKRGTFYTKERLFLPKMESKKVIKH